MNTETNHPFRAYRVGGDGIEAVDLPRIDRMVYPSHFLLLGIARLHAPRQKPRVAPRTAVGVLRAEGGGQ